MQALEEKDPLPPSAWSGQHREISKVRVGRNELGLLEARELPREKYDVIAWHASWSAAHIAAVGSRCFFALGQ